MAATWRPADARRCPHCGLYRPAHLFAERVDEEPDDEYLNWCLPCLRAEAGRLKADA